MTPDGNALRARHTLDSYEILEAVGQGGMGVVYRAHDHVLGRVVALKVLREDLRLQPHLVSRFQREARAVAALDHPNVVQVFAVGPSTGLPYIAMEFVEGQSLSEALRERGALPWDEALRIGEQIAQGLAAAHGKAVFHRDIKPGNILLDGRGHAYLTDFGIAKVVNADTQLTVDGSRLGTPQYMAPERCEGKDAGAASDIYALGVVMYQCIAGRLPFTAETPSGLLEQIVTEAIGPVSRFAEGTPRDVDRLIAWMTEKSPRHRPASAQVLADAMQRVLAGMPLDEAGPNLAGALAEFRDRLHTPTPAPPQAPAPLRAAASERLERYWSAARWRWRAWPLALRAGAAFLMGGALAGAAAWPLLRHEPDARAGLVSQPNGGAARWTMPAAAGVRSVEGPGLAIVRFPAEGYAVTGLAPSDGGAVDALLAAPGPAGRWTFLARTGADGSVALLGEPLAMGASGMAELAAGGARTAAVFRMQGGPVQLAFWDGGGPERALTFADPVSGAAFETSPVAVHGGRVAAAVRSAGGWRIALYASGAGGGFVFGGFAGDHGGVIEALRFDGAGRRLAVHRRNGEVDTLAVLDLSGGEAAAQTVASGRFTLPVSCWDGAGERIAAITERAGASWLTVYGADGKGRGETLAEASDAAFAGDGLLALMANDRRGETQMWQWTPGGAPAQRTFIDGGLRAGTLTATGAGRAAAACVRGAAYVEADLSR